MYFCNLYLTVTLGVYSQQPQFGGQVDLGIIEYDEIREASGIAASRKNSNVFWTHNDSGDENRLFAFDEQGRHLGEIVYSLVDGIQSAGIHVVIWNGMNTGSRKVSSGSYIVWLRAGAFMDTKRLLLLR